MASIPSELEAAIMALTQEEKAELVRLLIADLEQEAVNRAADGHETLPDWHREILEERTLSRDPKTDVDWADLKNELRNRSSE